MLAQRVFRNVIYNSSSILVANLAGLVVVIFLARALKPELFGIYSLSLSLVYLFSTFADLGINNAATRYIAEAVSKDDRILAGSYSSFLLKIKLFLSVFVAAIVFSISNSVSEIFEKPLAIPLQMLSLFLLFSSLSALLVSMANALNDFRINFINSTIFGLSKLLLTLSFVIIGLSLFGAILALVISSLISLLFCLLYIRRFDFLFSGKRNFQKSRIFRFIAFTAFLSFTWLIFANVDTVMVGYFLSSEDVAYYRAAFSIISAIIGLISFPAVLLPVFVKLEGESLELAFHRAFKYSSALCIPSAVGLAIISEGILLFAYGSDYIKGLKAMMILSALLISPIFGIYGSFFSSKERPELNFYPLLISMILNVFLNWILIPIYGIEGAAFATVVSNAIFWLLLAAICAREFRIVPKLDYLVKPAISAILMAFVGINLQPILAIPVCVAFYSAIMLLIKGITAEDISFIRKMAKIGA
uniref:Flippase n=1 Tax=Archaeoglobus fulgidus TaxID=2234 RepID=A0A7J2TLL2_ARCFL